MILKNDNIAHEVGYYGDKNVSVFGHEIYFRKEYTPDIEVKDDITGEVIGEIVLPEQLRDETYTVEALALGDECGEVLRNRKKRRMNGWPCGIVNPIKPGDRLLLPDGSDSLTHPYDYRNEGLISEFDVIAVIYDDDTTE